MTDSEVNLYNPDFSVATGPGAMWTVGYSFNDFLSLETGISFFTNIKKEFTASQDYIFIPSGKTTWDYKNYNFLPSIVFGHAIRKSTLDFKIYAGIGLSDLNVKATSGDLFKKYAFSKSISYTYGYGMEYQYNLSPIVQLCINAGINNTSFTPRHAKMVSSSDYFKSSDICFNEIDYLKDIRNLKEYYYNGIFILDTDKPEVRARETLKADSFYLGVGIKYIFIKNEKN